MERCKTPGFIFYPGPTPRPYPNPVSKAIRRPAHDQGSRPPACAVARHVAPVAIFVKIFVPGHFARNVVRGIRAVFRLVALECPVVKSIVVGNLAEIIFQMIGTGERGALVSHNRIGRASARNLAASAPHRHFGAIAVRIDVNPIISRLQDSERDVRRVDLIGVFVVHVTHLYN